MQGFFKTKTALFKIVQPDIGTEISGMGMSFVNQIVCCAVAALGIVNANPAALYVIQGRIQKNKGDF